MSTFLELPGTPPCSVPIYETDPPRPALIFVDAHVLKHPAKIAERHRCAGGNGDGQIGGVRRGGDGGRGGLPTVKTTMTVSK